MKLLFPNGEHAEVVLESGWTRVGSKADSDVLLVAPGIADEHCVIEASREQGDGVSVEDLGSSNGTYLNGTRIDVGVAQGGDELRFDTLRFVVVSPDQVIQRDETPAAQAPEPARPAAVVAPARSGVPVW